MLQLLLQTGLSAVTSGQAVPELPNNCITETFDLPEQADNLYAYNCCTDWPVAFGVVHPCWFAMQALRMQAQLFTLKNQPFKALGIVHVRNRIEMSQWAGVNDTVTISCQFGQVWLHKRGYMFNVITRVDGWIDGEAQQIMRIDGHYLARQTTTVDTGLEAYPQVEILSYADATAMQTQLPLPSDLGKVYAKISGDYNPIHLYPLTAKLFGLKRHIAHGMWTKAKVMSSTARHIWAEQISNGERPVFDHQLNIDVQFMQMIYLPAKIDILVDTNLVSTSKTTPSQLLAQSWVTSPTMNKPYLQMELTQGLTAELSTSPNIV